MKLSNQNIGKLINDHGGALKASIYIPTDPAKSTQDSIRLKNALQAIKNNSSYDEHELGDALNQIQINLVENSAFWNYQDLGLAVFFDHDGYEYFHIPFEVSEDQYLTDHFIISPLVAASSSDGGFYLLDLNFTQPRLFSGARGVLRQMEVDNMPGDYVDEVGREINKNILGFEDNSKNEDDMKYLRLVAAAVDEAAVYDNRVLILAGTTNRTGNIRSLLNHGNVLDETLDGNYEKATTEELYRDSANIIQNYLQQKRNIAVEELAGKPPELVVMGTAEIKEAAFSGRVDKLFLPIYRITNDSVRDSLGEKMILELPDDIEDIEASVRATLLQSGEVLAVEIGGYVELPEPKAICRY